MGRQFDGKKKTYSSIKFSIICISVPQKMNTKCKTGEKNIGLEPIILHYHLNETDVDWSNDDSVRVWGFVPTPRNSLGANRLPCNLIIFWHFSKEAQTCKDSF